MKKHAPLALLTTLTLLGGCVTAQEKALVNALDCEGLQAIKRNDPTSPNAILNDWDNDRRIKPYEDDNILDQSRTQRRDSYLRRQYLKKC